MIKRQAKAHATSVITPSLPKWDDDDKLSEWVAEVIADPRNAAECDPYLRPWRAGRRITSDAELFAAMEHAAIKAAKRGDPGPLANLLDHPRNALPMSFVKQPKLKPYTPSPEAAMLIADYLRGTRRQDLRATSDDGDERFYNSERHRAGRHTELVEIILRRNYPNEKAVRSRAITIVAKVRKIEPSTIENYFKALSRS